MEEGKSGQSNQPHDDVYHGDGGECDSTAPTAFRAAEKHYQLHREQLFRNRNGRRRATKLVTLPTDMSEVVDLQGGTPQEVADRNQLRHGFCEQLRTHVFGFPAHPGLYVLPGALDAEQQLRLATAALTQYCEPPSRTNHSAHHGALPCGLWQAALEGLCLQERREEDGKLPESAQAGAAATAGDRAHSHASSSPSGTCRYRWAPDGNGPAASKLLQRLRWATLGPPFDWTERVYRKGEPCQLLPPELVSLATSVVAAVDPPPSPLDGFPAAAEQAHPPPASQHLAAAPTEADRNTQPGREGPPIPPVPARGAGWYRPDVALVNYYRETDTLGGHKDDAERDLSHPIVSVSLGLDAVFLMGGEDKQQKPTALLLHSGDALVLAGHARRCFHGVPRVLPTCAIASETPGETVAHPHNSDAVLDHMQRCRINISIRSTG